MKSILRQNKQSGYYFSGQHSLVSRGSSSAPVRHLRDVCSVLRVLNTVCSLAKYLIFTPAAAVAATGGPTNKQYAVQNRNQWLQQNSQDSAQNPGGKGRKSNPCK